MTHQWILIDDWASIDLYCHQRKSKEMGKCAATFLMCALHPHPMTLRQNCMEIQECPLCYEKNLPLNSIMESADKQESADISTIASSNFILSDSIHQNFRGPQSVSHHHQKVVSGFYECRACLFLACQRCVARSLGRK